MLLVSLMAHTNVLTCILRATISTISVPSTLLKAKERSDLLISQPPPILSSLILPKDLPLLLMQLASSKAAASSSSTSEIHHTMMVLTTNENLKICDYPNNISSFAEYFLKKSKKSQ